MVLAAGGACQPQAPYDHLSILADFQLDLSIGGGGATGWERITRSPDDNKGLHAHDKLPQPRVHPAVPCAEIRLAGGVDLDLHAR